MPGTPPPTAVENPVSTRPPPTGARALGLAMFAVAFGTNVPTPLLLRYRTVLDLDPVALTAIFGVYAAGLVPTLFLAGPASDRLGRRAIVVPFTVLSLLASLVFLGASRTVAWLYVGRLLQGAVSGAVFSVGSAWMGELVSDPAEASRRAAVALTAGFGLGPLSAGVIGQYVPGTLTTSYLVHVGLVAAGLVVLARVPETVTRSVEPRPLVDLGVPDHARRAFAWFVVPAALCVFTFPSVSLAVLPLRLQAAMPGRELLVTGLVGGVTMVVGVLVQGSSERLGPTRAAPLGAVVGAAGIGVGLAAASADAPWLLLAAAALLGASYGATLSAGLTATQALAERSARGALTSTFYAVAYLGFAVPVVLSAVSDGTDYDAALVVTAVAALALGALLQRGPGAAHLHTADGATRRPPRREVR